MAFWVDDRDHSKPDRQRAWSAARGALGLHYLAGSYSAHHELDGFVPESFVEEKLPRRRERERTVDALVEAGMWAPVDDGYQLVDFLELNPSREKRAEQRARKREAGRRGGLAKAGRLPDA